MLWSSESVYFQVLYSLLHIYKYMSLAFWSSIHIKYLFLCNNLTSETILHDLHLSIHLYSSRCCIKHFCKNMQIYMNIFFMWVICPREPFLNDASTAEESLNSNGPILQSYNEWTSVSSCSTTYQQYVNPILNSHELQR